jgi:hypothetical protein
MGFGGFFMVVARSDVPTFRTFCAIGWASKKAALYSLFYEVKTTFIQTFISVSDLDFSPCMARKDFLLKQ